MEGTHRPTKIPASWFPRNQRPTESRSETKAAVRTRVLGLAHDFLEDTPPVVFFSIAPFPLNLLLDIYDYNTTFSTKVKLSSNPIDRVSATTIP
jgi:hypothetical protein